MLEWTIIAVLLIYITYKTYKKNVEISTLNYELDKADQELIRLEEREDKYIFLLNRLNKKQKRKFYNAYYRS